MEVNERQIGFDDHALAEQVKERKAREAAEQEEELAYQKPFLDE
jgi:hypothetical protein